MNKKLIILSGVVILLVVLVVGIFLVPQQSRIQQTKSTSVPVSSKQANQNQTTVAPSATTMPIAAATAQEAAKQFYTYYFSSAQNPLANGAYKDNPYLSSEFKEVIGALYKNGDVPVFCPQNKRANITIGQEQLVDYNDTHLTQEIISDATGAHDLYRVMLKNVDDTWLIFDVNCIQ